MATPPICIARIILSCLHNQSNFVVIFCCALILQAPTREEEKTFSALVNPVLSIQQRRQCGKVFFSAKEALSSIQCDITGFSSFFFLRLLLNFFKRHFQWCMWICCSYIVRSERSQHRKKHANWYWKENPRSIFPLAASFHDVSMLQCSGDAARCFGECFAFGTGKTFGTQLPEVQKQTAPRSERNCSVFSAER